MSGALYNYRIKRYTAPDELPSAAQCRRLFVPDDFAIIAAIKDVLAYLALPDVWIESENVTPEQMQGIMSQVVLDIDQDCPPEVSPMNHDSVFLTATTDVSLNTLNAVTALNSGVLKLSVEFPDPSRGVITIDFDVQNTAGAGRLAEFWIAFNGIYNTQPQFKQTIAANAWSHVHLGLPVPAPGTYDIHVMYRVAATGIQFLGTQSAMYISALWSE